MNPRLEKEINDFISVWDIRQLTDFFRDVFPLLYLYDVDEGDDWVKDAVGEEDTQTVRIIRTVYLLSKIAELHGGRLVTTNYQFKNLWKRIEKEAELNGMD